MANPGSIRSLGTTIPEKKRRTLCGARSRFHLAVRVGEEIGCSWRSGGHFGVPVLPAEVGEGKGDTMLGPISSRLLLPVSALFPRVVIYERYG